MKTRKDSLLPGGVPRYVRCYDNAGESADRYTVLLTGKAATMKGNGCQPNQYPYLAMDAHPFHPQGFGQHGYSDNAPCDTMGEIPGKWYWPPAIGRRCHLGKRIAFAELPEDCRKLVLQDYKEIWKL